MSPMVKSCFHRTMAGNNALRKSQLNVCCRDKNVERLKIHECSKFLRNEWANEGRTMVDEGSIIGEE